MRIVNRKEFLELSEGTLFSKYDGDQYCSNLCFKLDSIGRVDFDAIDIGNVFDFKRRDILTKSQKLDFTLTAMRDGCFDENQLFAVWETYDVIKLI